jgi:metal-sulfur cluster biosynthetic enzyme
MMPITDTAVRDALRQVIDPELGTNIVDLGLVYGIEIDGARVRVVMTMTSPACPLGDYLKDLVDSMVKWRVREVDDVEIVLVWEPRWHPGMMSAEAQHQLNGGTQ